MFFTAPEDPRLGFVVYYRYRETMKELSDAEFGRLMRAALEYGATEEVLELKGNEKFLFDTLKFQIDIEKAPYKTKES